MLDFKETRLLSVRLMMEQDSPSYMRSIASNPLSICAQPLFSTENKQKRHPNNSRRINPEHTLR